MSLTIKLRFPESAELDEVETIRFLASKLYEEGRLSMG